MYHRLVKLFLFCYKKNLLKVRFNAQFIYSNEKWPFPSAMTSPLELLTDAQLSQAFIESAI